MRNAHVSFGWVALGLVAMAWAGCGGDPFVVSEPEDGGTGGATGSAGGNPGQGGKAGGGAGQDGGKAGQAGAGQDGGKGGQAGSATSSPCPPTMDQLPSSFCTAGVLCEYGTDPRPGCRQKLTCDNSGNWVVLSGGSCTPLPGPGDPLCPATLEGLLGCTPISDGEGQICDMSKVLEGSMCNCSCAQTCSWQCTQPPQGCPTQLPRLGTSCDTAQDIDCAYGFCGTSTEASRRCTNGIWMEDAGGNCAGE